MVKLRVSADGRSTALRDTPLLVGRSPYCSLVLDDPSVSRLHALVRWVENGAEIRDLGSANGTWLNGLPISGAVPLGAGDVLKIGSVAVRIDNGSDGPTGLTISPGPYD